MQIELVPYLDIHPRHRLRTDYQRIDELAESIETFGLISPLVLDDEGRLIAGGRRWTAWGRLRAADPEKYALVPCVRRSTMPNSDLHMLELEENLQRDDLKWQERCIGITIIHRFKTRERAIEGAERWLQAETARLLNIPRGSIDVLIEVGGELIKQNKDHEIWQCSDVNDALQLLTRRRRMELEKKLADRYVASQDPVAKSKFVIPGLEDEEETNDNEAVDLEELNIDRGIDLSYRLARGDCLSVLRELPDGSVDHVVTDPPYALDIEAISQEGYADRFVGSNDLLSTHTTDGNLELYRKLLPELYRVTRPHSYVILFCDPNYWTTMRDIAKDAGFKVQNHPNIWVKGNCLNTSANTNFGKNYETILVARREHGTLRRPGVFATHSHSVVKEDKTELGKHPFIKPQALWYDLISNVADKGQTILDPFAGVGSSISAILQADCVPICIEIEEKFFNSLLLNMQDAYRDKFGPATRFYGVPLSQTPEDAGSEEGTPVSDLQE
jgi:DNA modification methylase